MATELQKNLAQEIVKNTKRKKPLNKKEMLVSVGYKQSVAETKPNEVFEAVGVKEALEDLGFTEDNAKKVVLEIMLNKKEKAEARLKATDQLFKIRGSYAPEKSVNLSVNVSAEAEAKANEAIMKFLNGNTGNS